VSNESWEAQVKLYTGYLSNFGAKSRLVVYEKGLNIEVIPSLGGSWKSPEYLKINPLGKIPALDADGLIITESETINEYLEEKFPTPALMPKTPEQRARVRFFTRFHDLYLDPPFRALIPQMNPKSRDEKIASEKLAELKSRLEMLEGELVPGGFATGAEFTLADCALVPTIFFLNNVMPRFGNKPPVETMPKIGAWWTRVQTRPSVRRVLAEMQEAFQQRMGGGQ
jgi:glutathione S-transferase